MGRGETKAIGDAASATVGGKHKAKWPMDGLCIFGCGKPGINGVGGCVECCKEWARKREDDANERARRDSYAWRVFRDEWRRANRQKRAEYERRFAKAHPHYEALMTQWVALEFSRENAKSGSGNRGGF